MGLCDGVSTGAEGRVGGQMAFTDLGKKLSVSWVLVVFMNHCSKNIICRTFAYFKHTKFHIKHSDCIKPITKASRLCFKQI